MLKDLVFRGSAQNSDALSGAKGSEPALRRRVVFALGVAAAAIGYAWLDARYLRPDVPHRDFDQLWFAARALFAGQNAYALVGPGAQFDWPWPLFYPLTAAVAVMPVALLPLLDARLVFVGIAAGAFAFTVTRDTWGRWPAVLSGPFFVAVTTAQWSPLLVAAFFIPALGGFLSVKPQIGGIFLIARPTRGRVIAAAVGAVALLGIATALQPNWINAWLATARTYASADAMRQFGGHTPVIPMSLLARPTGWVLLVAALRWRRAEARVLLLLAAVPHTFDAYEELALFIVPSTQRQTIALAALSQIATYMIVWAAGKPDYRPEFVATDFLVLMYIPALIMVLRRPNAEDESARRA